MIEDNKDILSDYANFIKRTKEISPNKVDDLKVSLEMLQEAVGSIVTDTGKTINKNISERTFDDLDTYVDFVKDGSVYEGKLSEMIESLTFDIVEEDDIEVDTELDDDLFTSAVTQRLDYLNNESLIIPNIESDNNLDVGITDNEGDVPNYEDYRVSTSDEYHLHDDFTHKRPYGFKLNENLIAEVNNWRAVYIKLAELLCESDDQLFMTLAKDFNFRGSYRNYFSLDPNELSKPYDVNSTGMYMETAHSANAIRDLIIKLLHKFNYNVDNFIVYLRADYTELN